jgi:hypothetical protein
VRKVESTLGGTCSHLPRRLTVAPKLTPSLKGMLVSEQDSMAAGDLPCPRLRSLVQQQGGGLPEAWVGGRLLGGFGGLRESHPDAAQPCEGPLSARRRPHLPGAATGALLAVQLTGVLH